MITFKPQDKIGAYTVLQLCGSGSYGAVYRVSNALSEEMALKYIPLANKYGQREIDGLLYYRRCRHSNLLTIRHVEKTDDAFYYTMDLADNAGTETDYCADTLALRLARFKTIPPNSTAKYSK